MDFNELNDDIDDCQTKTKMMNAKRSQKKTDPEIAEPPDDLLYWCAISGLIGNLIECEPNLLDAERLNESSVVVEASQVCLREHFQH